MHGNGNHDVSAPLRDVVGSPIEFGRFEMSDPIRLGLLGCGTVGSAVMRATSCDPWLAGRYDVAAVAVRDVASRRDCDVDGRRLTTSPLAVARSPDVDVVVEVMGGHEPARSSIEAALASGKPVVTANKALLATDGPDLLALAARQCVPLRYEAAVAGAIPGVRTLTELARTETVTRLDAVLNGTTTYVLAAMADRGIDLEEAVADAQSQGYAEADPSRDIDGRDAADKLTLLARLLWDVAWGPDVVHRLGITGLTPTDILKARSEGQGWQVVASATPRCAKVEPVRLPLEHPLARLSGTDNAIRVEGQRSGPLTLIGSGAGGDATAASVLADLEHIRRRRSAHPSMRTTRTPALRGPVPAAHP